MTPTASFRIAVLPGDGIGHEVMPPCLAVLEAVVRRIGGFDLTFDLLDAGAETYRSTGTALPARTLRACADADAILLAAMGLPHIRYADGTEIAPQLDLRFEFGLYAGLRPIRAIAGIPHLLSDPRAAAIDFVLVRESTEGLFASRGKGTVTDDREARDTLLITRDVSERLFDFSLRLAAQRRDAGGKGRVTCVDKANVFKSFAFFRRIFEERAAMHPDLRCDTAYVDACALNMVTRPWEFDVLVTENMFGDILSDLAAGLVGGMGYAPSADIGDDKAVFQPAHGSAPDIAGSGRANPTAMILSSAIMLDWLGTRHRVPELRRGARMIERAVDRAFVDGRLRTCELGGDAGTKAVANAVLAAIEALPAESGPV